VTALVLDPAQPYQELREPPLDESLRALLRESFAEQRRIAAARAPRGTDDRPGSADHEGRSRHGVSSDADGCAAHAVGEDALASILTSGRRVAGIATERDIATAIPFNVRNVPDVVRSRAVAARRRQLDRALTRALGALFADETPPVMFPAGHWWYPPGSHLGWHTNERFPGWRLYLSHAEQPGASFFRYRDPHSAAIVTSPDDAWNVRLFEVSPERPLWHAVASDTHRHSIGWIVRPWSRRDAAALAVKRTLATLCG